MQCCPRGYKRQHCASKGLIQCCLNTPEIILHTKTLCNVLSKRLLTTLHKNNPVQCRLNNIWSLFGNFYFRSVNFLIINRCCKCRANIVQIYLTLHIKNPGSTLNKKTTVRNSINSSNVYYLTVDFFVSRKGFMSHNNFFKGILLQSASVLS